MTEGYSTHTNLPAGNEQVAKIIHFNFAWENPAKGFQPQFDGFNAQFKASIGDDFREPKLMVEWFHCRGEVDCDTFDYPRAPDPAPVTFLAKPYDTVPPAIDSFAPVIDVKTGADWEQENIFPSTSQIGKNLCKEIWKYSDTAVGCVLLQGSLSRKFSTTDPSMADPTTVNQDLILDYVTYKTGLVYGDELITTIQYKFANVNVNYDTFNME